MTIIAQKMTVIKPSPTLAVADKAREMKLKGLNVISLSTGEPDFDTPNHIKESAIAAINAGQTKYTAVDGTAELKKAIINKLKKDNNLTYNIKQICVGAGAKQCIYNLFMATIDNQDEVLIPAPYWVSYPDMVAIAGGRSVIINCSDKDNFKLTPELLENSITRKTKWLIINSPSNPTGMVYEYKELKNLAQVLLKYPQVHIITDDIYEHITYDNTKFHTIAEVAPELYDRVFTVNGVSKAYSMTGWRIGYIAGKEEVIRAIAIIQSQSTTNPNSIAQAASVTALEGDQTFLLERNNIFKKRRDFVIDKLSNVPGLSVISPNGAFYIFVSCKELLNKRTQKGVPIKSDLDFSQYLLQDYLVAVVPGEAFGASGFFRISYATSEKLLEEACNRIISACQELV